MLLVPLYTNNLLSDFAIILLWQSYVPSMVNVMQYIFFFFFSTAENHEVGVSVR